MNEENTWKWQRVLFDKPVDELKWPPTSEDNICDLPPEILKAAQTLSSYFDSQGIHRWEIDNVCSRRISWGVQSTLQKKYREFMRRARADDNSAYIALAKAEEIRELAQEMGFDIEPKRNN